MDIKTGKVIFNENKVKMLGYSLEEFLNVDYTAFTNIVHPDDYEKVMKAMKDHLERKKELYEVKYRIKTQNGYYKWFHDRGSIVEKDEKGAPLTIKGVVFDITDLKKAEIELKMANENLEKIVIKRTKNLENINQKLREEIIERKKAEEYTNRNKQNLRNIIDSTSELIIAFDMNNRVSIWNKTSEYITGYKEIEVLNRSVVKLDVFENKDIIINQIKNVCEHKKPKIQDIILKTKDNQKRIIRTEGRDIKSLNKDCVGALFIGKDITKDLELHSKLMEGNAYLIIDKNKNKSIDLLIDLTINNYKGLILTRGNHSFIKRLIPESKNIEIVILTKETQKNYNNISDLISIEKKINNFINKNKKTVILLDGIHYLLTRFSFDEFIDTLYNINDFIAKNNSLFFVRIDPLTIDQNQMAILENELQMIPSQKTEDIIIEDYLSDIVKFILEQNQNNSIVSYKKLMAQFKISYVTAASRLNSLEKKGLIFTKKQGKLRAIFITEKGKLLLNSRKTV